MGRHLRQEFRAMEVEIFAQLQPQRPLRGSIFRKADAENGGRASVEVNPLLGGENGQAGVISGIADSGTQSGYEIGRHGFTFLRKSPLIVPSYVASSANATSVRP